MKEFFRIGLIVLCIFSASAYAEVVEQLRPSDRWAAGYAHKAVEQHKESQELHCGFKEDRWHHDFYSHQAWALRSGKQQARSENLIREDLLEKCKQARAYLAKAMEQVNQNVERSCGYTGPEWNQVEDVQFDWAMLHDQAEMETKIRERKKALATCK